MPRSKKIGTPIDDDNQAVAPGSHDDEKSEKVIKNIKEGRRHLSKWRVDTRTRYDFYAGKQWSPEDEKILTEQKRPAVVFNRIPRTINAVAGLELQNRQEVRFLPRRANEPTQDPNQPTYSGFGEVLTSAAKWVRDQCDAEDEESEAFQDALICGMGWTETRIDYEQDPEGKIIIERIDPLEMGYDPEAKKRNLVDARWIYRVKDVTPDEFRRMFPNEDVPEPNLFWKDSESSPHDADNDLFYKNDQSDKLSKPKLISIVDYQYYETENAYKVLSQSGQLIEIEESKFNKIKEFIEANGLRYVKFPKRVYKRIFLTANRILEDKDLGCDHFTFNAITGLRDRNSNTWFGLVALMQDPQMWANKWLSQIQHILNTNAKGGLLVEEGAISDIRKFEDSWAKPDGINFVNNGALSSGQIQQKEMARYPEGIDRLLQYAIQSINDVPGINLELIGMTDRDQANVLEQSRKQAGITLLANFFDSLRRYRKVQGRVLAYFIREYISDGRLIRVTGQAGAKYIPLMKDQLAFEYDIVVDDAPTSPNMKERVFLVLVQILPLLLQAGIPIPPDVIDYSPLPEDLQQKWKAMIAGSQNDPVKKQMQQAQMQLTQLEVMGKEAEIGKTKADTTLSYAKAEQAQATGQDEAAQAMQKMGMEHQLEQEKMIREQAREDMKLAQDVKRKQIDAAMDFEIKQQDHAMQMQNKAQEYELKRQLLAQTAQQKMQQQKQKSTQNNGAKK
jgi:hypothetical protein